ncbi:bifunctional [glutamate--ammonia ligase]-adenylyl-L-tyrosine phosphorylase/[glutamate--ammonia-ligase] adenylyltransferase [Pseudoalteromonas sp. BZB3]|uniref:bifunctional [glutamate--ammonia ligase]-adenylyl-L-tyrosine phosphorylase/[glutamate--ammonia-ligase] adenylyltransferase n=1 Tax=Pseudoalteromonas sp. BZB3 TaxID=3136670 RepID=UPI0032C4588A
MHQVDFPLSLLQLAEQRWQQLYGAQPYDEQLGRLIGLSDFAFRILEKRPELGTWLQQLNVDCRIVPEPLTGDLVELSELVCFKQLRLYRQQYWLKVMWLDLVHQNPIEDSIEYISKLSEALIGAANQWAFAQTTKQCGAPLDEQGNSLPMLVLGMGKLGGGELNFSSDIDLIFTYPRNLSTQGGRRSFESQVFYTKVAQKLISALNQVTADGQVFRVDMRLRPFGESGPLVMSFAAMEDYYQDQGREWERYAMLKARPLGEETCYWDEFKQLLKPFVYRRYIDFSVIESLRKMKHLISQEVRRKGLVNNIKLGAGGIREVEFIVQALQMIRGGRDVGLQTPSILAAISELTELDILPSEVSHSLKRHYLFLRRVEQYLQAFDDQQTQTLPDSELDKVRLAYLLEHQDFQSTLPQINQVMESVRQEFALVVGDEPQEQTSFDDSYSYAWLQRDCLQLEGVLEAEKLAQWQNVLVEFDAKLNKRHVGIRGRDILDKLMPALLHALAQQKSSAELLLRVLNIVEMIATRTTYLELLFENQGALKQLVLLCGHSKWIAEHIAKYPILLDELIDPAALYKPLPLSEYRTEIRQYFLRIEQDDLELQMEALRQFKQAHQLRIAAADATGVLSIMKVSDHLTALAEAIVSQSVNLAWQQMVSRYGEPQGCNELSKGFAVIAYGKAGGLELGYDSDLDLVFVHNQQGDSSTIGNKQISSRQFYLKLAQRLMHLFNTRTASGILYELDTRLRPEGNSGLLAINIESFNHYQQSQAWTWEHQALTRARMIYGETELVERFAEIRKDILCTARDEAQLKDDVVKMREKMRAHLSKDSEQAFDLKQGHGGMTDIEFIAQFLVLNHAKHCHELTHFSDNIRILESAVQQGVINSEQQTILTECYCTLREHYHLNSLNQHGRCVPRELVAVQVELVRNIWQQLFN